MKKSVFLLTIVFAVVLSVWGQNANPNQTFIKNVMLIGGSSDEVTDYANTSIPAFNGVVVEAAGENDTVVFSKTQPSMATHHNGSLQMTLTRDMPSCTSPRVVKNH